MTVSDDFTIAFEEPDEDGWIVAPACWRFPALSARAV
jgi:hypothetical protein